MNNDRMHSPTKPRQLTIKYEGPPDGPGRRKYVSKTFKGTKKMKAEPIWTF